MLQTCHFFFGSIALFLFLLGIFPKPSIGMQFYLSSGDGCSTLIESSIRVNRDSSIEIEIPYSKIMHSFFTTESGTIREILDGQEPPSWILEIYQSLNKNYEMTAEELSWDLLNWEQAKRLIAEVSRRRTKDFYRDRKIHGLKLREKQTFHFKRKTAFLGQTYEPGEHEIGLGQMFMSHVEYGGPGDVRDFKLVEIHLRMNEPPGDLVQALWAFQKGIGLEPTPVHVHMVAPLPYEELSANPSLKSLQMADFYRRVNLLAEILGLMEGESLISNSYGGSTYFNILTPGNLGGIRSYFQSVGEGSERQVGSDFKLAWVGFRGSDKYDEPGLWGLEYRAIDPQSDPKLVGLVLNNIFRMMNLNNSGVSDGVFPLWAERVRIESKGSVQDAFSKLLYNQQHMPSMIKAVSPQVREVLTDSLARYLMEEGLHANEIKMFLFDWSRDPMFFSREDILRRIQVEQVSALKKLAKPGNQTPSKYSRILIDFLWNSGIAETVADSLDMQFTKKQEQSFGVYAKP